MSFDADGLTRALYSEPPELRCDRLSADSLALSSELPELKSGGKPNFQSIARKWHRKPIASVLFRTHTNSHHNQPTSSMPSETSHKKSKKKKKKIKDRCNAEFVQGPPPDGTHLKRPNSEFVQDEAGQVRLEAIERVEAGGAVVACDSPLRALFEEQHNLKNGELERMGMITHFKPYASQNEATCGARVEDACGLVSLYNALVHRSVPVDFVRLAELFDQSHAAGTGLSPGELRDFTVRALAAFAPHLRATLHEGGAKPTVRAGSLIFVDSVRLKNAA